MSSYFNSITEFLDEIDSHLGKRSLWVRSKPWSNRSDKLDWMVVRYEHRNVEDSKYLFMSSVIGDVTVYLNGYLQAIKDLKGK